MKAEEEKTASAQKGCMERHVFMGELGCGQSSKVKGRFRGHGGHPIKPSVLPPSQP